MQGSTNISQGRKLNSYPKAGVKILKLFDTPPIVHEQHVKNREELHCDSEKCSVGFVSDESHTEGLQVDDRAKPQSPGCSPSRYDTYHLLCLRVLVYDHLAEPPAHTAPQNWCEMTVFGPLSPAVMTQTRRCLAVRMHLSETQPQYWIRPLWQLTIVVHIHGD